MLTIIFIGQKVTLFAQPKLDFELKKPKQYEERLLGSEKNADKNFTLVRRFFQNTYTHYNYYFNANKLINEIIIQATVSNSEDYTDLLGYYPWDLEQTSKSGDIDSILQKCTAGILLHDLRNNWIDNMYLLMGKAYYLRKDFDSASMAFQYLNYSYAPKEKGGYDKPIGSNADEGSNAFTIMTREKKNYIGSRPPSRNDGFVWQVRNLTDKGSYLDAHSLIAILRNDPNFPKRLEPNLSEVTGYLYYKLSMWDSAAVYLEKSIPIAENPSDKARRWFLVGQLYQLGGNSQKASEAYSNCLGVATDLVMDVYARLNSIRLRKNDNPNIINENIADLVGMAKKDKYTEYRDIIYYAAGMVELERDGYEAAAHYFQKSLAANTNNAKQRTLSFLALADTRFSQKAYGKAGQPYDSSNVTLLKYPDSLRVTARRPGCLQVYNAEAIIFLQDSLIRLAEMDETDRTKKVKKITSDLRKAKGLAEEPTNMGGVQLSQKNDQQDLFKASSSNTWYFSDQTVRANGFNSFKEKWGARPNVDNWRRSSAINFTPINRLPNKKESGDPDAMIVDDALMETDFDSTDISFDNLYSRIPLTPERKAKAEEQVINALYSKASAIHEKIEDYEEAIKVYEEILRRGAKGNIASKTLFGLVHCYMQTGNKQKAKELQQRLETEFGKTVDLENRDKERTALEDKTYEEIYDLFLSGDFKKAVSEKEKADSTIGKGYWKPQLFYIQSVYYIQQKQDSLAIKELTTLSNEFPNHPLAKRAPSMIDVLRRRKQIEEYLTRLEVTRMKEDEYDSSLFRPSQQVIVALPQNATPLDSAKQKEAELLAQKQAKEREAQMKAEKEAYEKQEAERLAIEEAEKAKQAEAERLAAEKAAIEKAEAEKLAAEKALAEKQAIEKARADQELADKIAAEKAKAEKELADKQAAEKAQAEKELAEKQAREKEALEKDAANKAEAEKALAEKQALEKAALEKEMAEKQAAEKQKAEKEMAEKQAAEKAQAEKDLAAKQLAEKAEAEKLAREKLEAEKLAAAKKAQEEKEALEKAVLARQSMVDNVVVGTPTTPSPYKIKANERQVVVIVLEKIDPAYVNEVSYSLGHTPKLNREGDEVTVGKKKVKEGLWLVELSSPSFTNMQASYEYIKYITPITQNELVTWLDARKYFFISISEANLKEMVNSQDAQLYRKVLQEAIPGKF